ncbi:hypothetical protein CCACVL1_01046 [Corchorus capsularis]|uniref:Uncharacterized protein n=1 Tax=Corchorus capsularis TaxID=210143 RepID=A0A1R3KRM4_COCAP|nr:hypothetical protein CCACVL1_01046 [Corchorus capsularis]
MLLHEHPKVRGCSSSTHDYGVAPYTYFGEIQARMTFPQLEILIV